MYNHLLNFLNQSNILTQNQYGFRENQSTFISVLKLVDDISEELNDKNHLIGICIDLSKACDTIDLTLLIKTRFRYGVKASFWTGSLVIYKKKQDET